MHPTIAALIATEHQRELRASAEHQRRLVRTRRSRKASPEGTVRGYPRLGFQAWLATGRL